MSKKSKKFKKINMAGKNNNIITFTIDKRIILGSIIGTLIGWGAGYFVTRNFFGTDNDESGKIVSKSNYELFVDTDGDKSPDNTIKFSSGDNNGLAIYEYAQPGDKIVYKNTYGHDKIYADDITEVNGKSTKELVRWYEMLQHANMHTR